MNTAKRRVPRILLLGARGRIGRELATSLKALGKVFPVDRKTCDLTDFDKLRGLLADVAPDIIVNAAALTGNKRVEAQLQLARIVNVRLPGVLAQYAAENDALYVDYSTSQIYDGDKRTPWLESDPSSPVNAYGQSKLEAMRMIRASGCRHLILVLGWVYSTTGNSFVQYVLKSGRGQAAIRVAADQVGTPTPAAWIAEMTCHCIPRVIADPQKSGHYHLAPMGGVSLFEFAKEILGQANAKGLPMVQQPDDIKTVTTPGRAQGGRSQKNALLDTARLQQQFDVNAIPHWRALFRSQSLS